jgi:hypothetical protein
MNPLRWKEAWDYSETINLPEIFLVCAVAWTRRDWIASLSGERIRGSMN